MNHSQVNIQENKITISVNKAPLFIRVVLSIFIVFLALIPLAVTFFALTYGDGLHIGIAFSFLIGWGVGFYLLRITLWNSVGREILSLNPESIVYLADYILFKDGRQKISTTDLRAETFYEDKPNKSLGRLRLKSNSAVIETALLMTLPDLEEIKTEIQNRYPKT
jgi:hypothetical protein